MMSVNELINSLLELPVEERVIIADIVTQSINPSNYEIEQNWITEINRRLQALENGNSKTISYQEFFDEN
jgi:putative addiction module component (TIGR02574 family)